jgi:hypothetical protein
MPCRELPLFQVKGHGQGSYRCETIENFAPCPSAANTHIPKLEGMARTRIISSFAPCPSAVCFCFLLFWNTIKNSMRRCGGSENEWCCVPLIKRRYMRRITNNWYHPWFTSGVSQNGETIVRFEHVIQVLTSAEGKVVTPKCTKSLDDDLRLRGLP